MTNGSKPNLLISFTRGPSRRVSDLLINGIHNTGRKKHREEVQ